MSTKPSSMTTPQLLTRRWVLLIHGKMATEEFRSLTLELLKRQAPEPGAREQVMAERRARQIAALAEAKARATEAREKGRL